MAGKFKIFIILLVAIIGTSLLYFLLLPDTQTQSSDQVRVVVSVAPQEEFVKAVGKDKVQVTVMVPSGADPHTYEPLPKQMQELSQAQLYLMVGSPLEFELTWMDKMRAMNPQMKVVNTSQGITLLPSQGESSSDPHVWVSPRNARVMVENTYQALVEVDPDNQKYYQENRDQYLERLDQADQNLTHSLQKVNSKKILVYHPAWAYLCRDYGLEQISIEKEGKEPTSQDLTRLVDQARQENITLVFVSPQHNQENAQVIADELGGELVVVDPLASNYLENMAQVAEAFSRN
ncbi:metal ABC transporter solute-binding protein, Zn/Mn family [Methanobacterium sp. CWC-01]|uniref:metal ABC transporter solute-binding protein, Zn/Mn family n=1 Tax=Methanobacterium aridiramus TaxID=2584467 RepID=UPI002578F9A6|nr:zinc ABC transporter substrate-binding protein [Methanobacterium sp. CWC-01]